MSPVTPYELGDWNLGSLKKK